jgi:hypothetical protein
MQELEQSLEDVESYLEHTLADFEEVPAEAIAPAGSGRLLYESGVGKNKMALAAIACVRGVIQQISDADLMQLSEQLQKHITAWQIVIRSSNED